MQLVAGHPLAAKMVEAYLNLEQHDYRHRFVERILREKALVAQARGDFPSAKLNFVEGIKTHRAHAYPDNHIGLAQLLLREIDELPPDDPERVRGAAEALKYLRVARKESAVFDRFHLGTYVEALMQAGHEVEAIPLLLEGLVDKPDDARLNYRMAEVLRNKEAFDDAEQHVRRAIGSGAEKARLTLANILHGRALREHSRARQVEGDQLLTEALSALNSFKPEFGTDQEVADSIAAKAYRSLGKWEEARASVASYGETRNSYTVYEQTKVDQHDSKRPIPRKVG